MPDWGTFISDYQGKMHNVARASFDSLTKSARDPLNVSDPVLRNTFTETFKVFKKNIGDEFNLEGGDFTLEQIGDKLRQQLQNTGFRMGLETGAGYLAAKAGAVEGPLGILLTEAVTIAASEFTHLYAGTKAYKPGQWVFIDCGLKTKKINRDAKVVELKSNYDLFGSQDFAVIPDDLDYASEPIHTIGFYLGKGDAPYMCSVFSFRTGKEELLNEDKIRLCPEDYAKKLDKDPNFSAVREVRFMKDHDPTLQTYLPTEPGDHVMLGNDRCTILEVHGDEYLLENGDGSHIMVHSSDIRAGKTKSSARWNHDLTSLGAFTSLSPDTIFEGEWVWINAGDFVADLIGQQRRRMAAVPQSLQQMGPDNKILAMVKHVEGGKVEVVRAFDGETLDLKLEEVVGSSSKIEGLLNHDSKMAEWKFKTLEGQDPHYNAPGTIHPMLALGLGDLDDELLEEVKMKPHMTKKGSPVAKLPRTEPIRVMQGTNNIEDARRKTEAQDALEDIQNQYNSRTEKVVMADMPSSEGAIPGSTDGSTFLWIAGAVVILAFYSS